MRAASPPGPRPHPILGHLPAFRRDPLGFLLGTARHFDDVVALRIGPRRAYLLPHPDLVQHVLHTNRRNYAKRAAPLRQLGTVLGRGLVTSDGALWRRQRQLIQPAFHPARIEGYVTAITAVLADVTRHWRSYAARGCVVDVRAEMVELAFRVVGVALFGADLQAVAVQVREAVGEVQQQTRARLYRLFASPLWVPTHANRAFRSSLATLDGVVYALIAARRRAGSPSRDLLDTLLEARDQETGEPMESRQVRDEVLTLLLAGHENTANALTWTWYLVATHRDVGDRLAHEAETALGDRAEADLEALPYAHAVAREALRLYPTSWLLLRRAVDDDRVGGWRIPRGATILISPYVTHRHPGYWPQPERFDPERFSAERVAAQHPFAYLPFGAGLRKCIGAGFAAAEMRLAIATLARHFRLELAVPPPVEPEPLVSLLPRGGLPMRIRVR